MGEFTFTEKIVWFIWRAMGFLVPIFVIHALIADFQADRIGYMILDILIFPFGFIRGVWLFLELF